MRALLLAITVLFSPAALAFQAASLGPAKLGVRCEGRSWLVARPSSDAIAGCPAFLTSALRSTLRDIPEGPGADGTKAGTRGRDETAQRGLPILSEQMDRRSVLISTPSSALLASVLPFLGVDEAQAASEEPVIVIGAGGGTGKECVKYLLTKGIGVKTLVRSKVTSKGEQVAFEAKGSSMLEEVLADVTSQKAMTEAIAGSRAVIFAASASKKGGDPKVGSVCVCVCVCVCVYVCVCDQACS